MKTFAIAAAALLFSVAAAAQKLNLDFPNLAAQAKEKAEKEVTVVEILGTADLNHLQEIVKSTIKFDLKSPGGEESKEAGQK